MIKVQRIENILAYVEEYHTVSFEQLSRQFAVSLNTIRRDTNQLINDGKLRKVHGGVTLDSSSAVEYEERAIVNEEAKKQIAKVSASLIEDDDIVFVDTGTTTTYLVDYITNKNVTVITNNLDFIGQSKNNPELTVISTGGLFDRSTNSFVHLQNSDVLDTYNINKAFMATTGVSLPKGVTHASPLENVIKKQVVQKDCEVYVLADNSKFGKQALFTYSYLKDIDVIVTEQSLPKDFTSYFEKHNIQLHTKEIAI